MSTISPDQVKLTIDVTRQIVERLAPDEIEVFEVYSAAFEQDSSSFDSVLKGRDTAEALGFDTGQVTSLVLTGLVLPVVKEVVLEVYKLQQKKAASEGWAIPKSSLKAIRRRVYALARKASLGEEQAAELSDNIVKLVLQKSVPLGAKKPS